MTKPGVLDSLESVYFLFCWPRKVANHLSRSCMDARNPNLVLAYARLQEVSSATVLSNPHAGRGLQLRLDVVNGVMLLAVIGQKFC